MSAESDLLRVVLALHNGLVSHEQVRECGAIWEKDRSRPLVDILEEKGHLKKGIRSALEALVAEHVEKGGGDPAHSLAALPVDEDIRRIILELPLEDAVKGTLLEWKAAHAGEQTIPPPGAFAGGATTMAGGPAQSPEDSGGLTPLRRGETDRYAFKGELGRGGLGKVIEAVDKDFGREVAVKMMLPDQPTSAVERFLLEGRAAGKLTHPNIVSIHEIGMLKQEQGEAPYFTMEKIVGRDLKEILQDLERGDEETSKRLNRPRLLRVFQEVCNAMAYSHDHGVIHRDLKPSNVMVGEYGEVFVVDWGLAKLKGEKDAGPGGMTRIMGGKPTDTPQLTMDGQVLGTPAYMPPEQAEGRIAEIDERSDIYSLGAILYEILTFHPPFEGETVRNVISNVLTEDVTPPSARVSEIRDASAVKTGPDSKLPPIEDIPPELDDIVLQALSKDKTKRYATARELSEDVQLFLEGEKERERNHQQAMAKVTAGKVLMEKMEKMRADLKELEKEAEEKGKEVKPHWPVERKKDFWAQQDRAEELRKDIVRTYTAADNALHEALGFERHNREARAALADMYWDRYTREEEGGNESEMLHYEGLVREYNDGQYDAKLKGDGTLSVSASAYPCKCLTEGRMVSPEELAGGVECGVSSVEIKDEDTEHSTLNTEHLSKCGIMGYHPFSGRALDGRKGAEGLPELEPKEPVHLRVHGPECEAEPVTGADVWLLRFEEKEKILLPVFPEGIEVPGARREETPARILDRCFDRDSPYRPKEGLCLGKTPVDKFTIPMGSYLLIVHKDGFHPVRCPMNISRCADEVASILLYRDGEIPDGFVQVPEGRFIYQGDKENPYSAPKEIKETDDLLMAKFPVTCREYLVFLNDLVESDSRDFMGELGDTSLRVPRESEKSGYYWPFVTGSHDSEGGTPSPRGRCVIPTKAVLAEAPPELKEKARRLAHSPVDWEEYWPVFGVSWEDATAYAAWYSRKTGLVAGLAHEVEWEKTARGVDGRFYPFGNHFEDTYSNGFLSHGSPPRPCSVEDFPQDESAYGVRGLGGNSGDWCLNDVEEGGRRLFRGGSWLFLGVGNRLTSRRASPPTDVDHVGGIRLCVRLCALNSPL